MSLFITFNTTATRKLVSEHVLPNEHEISHFIKSSPTYYSSISDRAVICKLFSVILKDSEFEFLNFSYVWENLISHNQSRMNNKKTYIPKFDFQRVKRSCEGVNPPTLKNFWAST